MSSPRFFCGHCGAIVSDPDEHHCPQTPLERQVSELRATILAELAAIDLKLDRLAARLARGAS